MRSAHQSARQLRRPRIAHENEGQRAARRIPPTWTRSGVLATDRCDRAAAVTAAPSPKRGSARKGSGSGSVASRCGGACRRPGSEHVCHDRCRGPIAVTGAVERAPLAPASMRDRPVVRGRQPRVTGPPCTHRVQDALGCPAPVNRAGVAGLTVGVRVALAVARLRVRATTAAHSSYRAFTARAFSPVGS